MLTDTAQRSARTFPAWGDTIAAPGSRGRRAPVLLLAACLLGLLLAARPGAAAPAPAATQRAPRNHSPLIIACPGGHPPFSMRNDAGEPAGLLVDFWRLWSERAGIPVSFRVGTWKETETWILTSEADIHSGLIRTPERQRELAFSRTLFELDSALAAPYEGRKRNVPEEFRGRSLAVVRGSPWERWLRERLPDVHAVPVADGEEALRSVLEGRAGGILMELPTIARVLDLNGRSGDFQVTTLPELRQKLHAAVRRDRTDLLKAVDQGLAALGVDDLAELERRWLPAPSLRLASRAAQSLTLTESEEAWLAAHPRVRVGLAGGGPPLCFRDAAGRAQGVVPDYLRLLARKIELQTEIVPGLDRSLRFGALRRGEVDMLACVLPTPTLRQEFLFTDPYLRLPSVIVTRTDAPFLTGLADILGKTVTMPADAGRVEMLYRDYPELDLRLADSVAKALEEVSLGRAYATVGDLPTLSAVIRNQGFTNLKVAARTEYGNEAFCMAVRRDMPELVAILNRALASLGPGERDAVTARWVDTGIESDANGRRIATLALRAGGVGLLALCLLLLWNWRLNKEVRRRRRTEEALASAERELREIYDHVPVGIFRISDEGEILSVNKEMLRIGGYESLEQAEELSGNFSQAWYVDEIDRDLLHETLREKGEIREFLYRARRRDGRVIWISESARLQRAEDGAPNLISGYALDATERILTLEDLRRGEARLRAIVLNSPFVILSMDDALRIELPLDSPAVERITSYPPDELRGELFVDFVHPEDALRTDYQLRRFMDVAGESVSLHCRWRCRDGSWRYMECNGVNYRNHPDHAGVLLILQDVTDQREAQERLIQARQAAENADRAKSEFLASMSHEIRTPMNAILGMAEVLSETELSGEQRSYVELFRNAGESLLSLINDILDLSKVEAGQVELETIPFDLRELVEKLAHIMGIRARKSGVELRFSLADDLPAILNGDPVRLRQILANLLSNAVKFTPRGSIDLDVRREDSGHGPEMLHFSVRDTGIGIPPNKIKDIFESFVQADSSTTRRYGGTGLGLTISQRLVALMNGRIWVESELGRGSVFHFNLPLNDPSGPAADGAPRLPEDELERALPRARVLFVEDTESNRTLIEAYLEPTAVELDMAGDGREALEKFAEGGYDLVLMDMQLPVMNGFDAVRAIRRMERERGLAHTPVFALTAFALKGDAEKCIQAGCDMHIAKPVLREDFLRILLEQFTGRNDPDEDAQVPETDGEPDADDA